MSELNDEDKLRAKLIESALLASGLMQTILSQVDNAVKDGKVSIADASKHREILITQAAQTMAKGIEGVFNTLTQYGYQIIKVEDDGEDTSVATQGGAEPQGRTEREGQGVSQGSGLEPQSSSEGSTEWSRGNAT